MKSPIYEITQIGAGKLAVMPKPVAGDAIEAEFRDIAKHGIDQIVSLLGERESALLGLQDEKIYTEKFNMRFVSFPIADFSVPRSFKSFDAITRQLCRQIASGVNTVIHCRGGIGRSGMVGAGVLIQSGLTPAAAFDLLSDKRGLEVPDTQAQIDWVTEFYQQCCSSYKDEQH